MKLDEAAQERDFRRWVANPGPAPEQSDFSLASAIKSGFKGFPSGALDAAGGVADLLSGYATADAASRGDADASRRLREGLQFDATAGNILRATADSYAPDPQTSHAADQVIHGLTRGVGKAVGAVVMAGPYAGAGLFGIEEANNTYQRLLLQGVDERTAAKVAGVTGLASAIGAGAPAGGSTWLRTFGIAATTGPATYVAQETIARDVLQQAGYQDEADKHDPTDALGLLLSIGIPGAVGAVHMRGVSRQKRLTEVVQHIESGGRRYGKDGQLLTSPKGAQGEMQVMPGTATDPGFGVKPAQDNSPDELARVGRDYLSAMGERYAGDTEKALAAYNAGPGAVDRAVKAHGDNWLSHMPDETKAYVGKANRLLREGGVEAAAADPAVVDAARVRVLDETMARSLPDRPEAFAEVMRATDEVAAGERFLTQEMEAQMREPSAQAEDLRALAQNAYWAEQGGRMIRDPESGDVTARTKWIPAEEWFGAMRAELGRNGLAAQEQIAKAVEKAVEGKPLSAAERRTVDWMRMEVDRIREESARYDWVQPNEFADDVAGAGLRYTDVADAALVTRAAQLDEGRVERAAIAHEADDSAFMAEIRSILNEYGANTNPGPAASRESAPPARPARQATGHFPGEAAPAKVASAESVASPDKAAIERLSMEQPDLLVKLPGSDETVSVKAALERIEAERADEAQEADWVRVALECALTGGRKAAPAAP